VQGVADGFAQGGFPELARGKVIAAVVAAFLAVAAGRRIMGSAGEDGEAVFALEEQCADVLWQASLGMTTGQGVQWETRGG
jgi:hypothetical protein